MPLKNLDSPNARISTVSDKDSDYYWKKNCKLIIFLYYIKLQ